VKADEGKHTVKPVWFQKDDHEQKTDHDRDIARRFMRPVKLMLYKNKDRDRLLASNKSKEYWLKKHKIDLDASVTIYDYRWGGFSALRRHLTKNNKKITLSPLQLDTHPHLPGETES
jgi:hypothetical protein